MAQRDDVYYTYRTLPIMSFMLTEAQYRNIKSSASKANVRRATQRGRIEQQRPWGAWVGRHGMALICRTMR